MSMYFAELSAGGTAIRFAGSYVSDGLVLSPEGVEGWYSTPDAKVPMTERGQGDGAHDLTDMDVAYAARTVTMHWSVAESDRAGVLGRLHAVLAATSHRLARLMVVDAGMATYVEGYATHTVSARRYERIAVEGVTTMVCPRPERLAYDARRWTLTPSMRADGGLWYGDSRTGLVFPLRFGTEPVDAGDRCVIDNRGTSRAYPVYTVEGDWPDGCLLSFDGDRFIQYRGAVRLGAPVTLDTRSRTASVNGVDVSQNLTLRDFPTVPPGGSLMVTAAGAGGSDATVSVLCRDTYM